MPEAGSLAAPLGLSMLASALLQTRRLSLPRLAGGVIASQAIFHVLFVMGAGGAHVHGASLAGDVSMWAMHVLAALATIVFLARGEQAIHRLREVADRLAAWIRVRLAGPIVVPALPARSRVRVDTERNWLQLSQLHASAQPHRGPPITN